MTAAPLDISPSQLSNLRREIGWVNKGQVSLGRGVSKNKQTSAGLLMYRIREGQVEFFLAHPGGPFFFKRDAGHWTIPKGRVNEGETLQEGAFREFLEEVGAEPKGEMLELGSIQQKSGKTVHAWAFEGDWKEGEPPRSLTFAVEWPPQSNQFKEFPEVDRVGFFSLTEAKVKLKEAQQPFLERLICAISPRLRRVGKVGQFG